MTAPEPASACTAKYRPAARVAIVVSKPSFGALATGASVLGEEPASTRQDATAVAPFQLAATVTRPDWPLYAATEGAVSGCPLHCDSRALKFCTPAPSVASSRTCPAASYSVRFGSRP